MGTRGGSRIGLVGATVLAAALLGVACSSSGGTADRSGAAAPVASRRQATTTPTQPGAIGLRVNADERAENVPDKPLAAAERRKLAEQLVAARATAMAYPTVADATRAGYILAGQFTPGAGAHYVSIANGAASFTSRTTAVDPSHPLALIYDGTAPTSRVVGLMYGSFAVNPPDGFTGPNDHWHRHTNLCIVYHKGSIGIPYPPDTDVKKSACDALHGTFMRETLWMLHAWVVPGWESPQGVFSHANIDLHCGDGTDNTDKIGFCKGATD